MGIWAFHFSSKLFFLMTRACFTLLHSDLIRLILEDFIAIDLSGLSALDIVFAKHEGKVALFTAIVRDGDHRETTKHLAAYLHWLCSRKVKVTQITADMRHITLLPIRADFPVWINKCGSTLHHLKCGLAEDVNDGVLLACLMDCSKLTSCVFASYGHGIDPEGTVAAIRLALPKMKLLRFARKKTPQEW